MGHEGSSYHPCGLGSEHRGKEESSVNEDLYVLASSQGGMQRIRAVAE